MADQPALVRQTSGCGTEYRCDDTVYTDESRRKSLCFGTGGHADWLGLTLAARATSPQSPAKSTLRSDPAECYYGPFGADSGSVPNNPNPYRYTSRWRETGDLYYYRARYYQPEVGRFLEKDHWLPDPDFDRGQSLHRYSYVENCPANWRDPMGRMIKKQPPEEHYGGGGAGSPPFIITHGCDHSFDVKVAIRGICAADIPLDTNGTLNEANWQLKARLEGYCTGVIYVRCKGLGGTACAGSPDIPWFIRALYGDAIHGMALDESKMREYGGFYSCNLRKTPFHEMTHWAENDEWCASVCSYRMYEDTDWDIGEYQDCENATCCWRHGYGAPNDYCYN